MQKQKIKEAIQKTLTTLTVSSLLLFGLYQGIYSTLGIIQHQTLKAKARIVSYIMGDLPEFTWVINVPRVKAKEINGEQVGTKAWAIKKWSNRFGAEVAWQLETIMDLKESGWNANAYHCNTNGTVDLSWYQINSVHVKSGKLSLACAADPICSTDFAMDLYEEQGWCPWSGAKKLGFCQ